MSEEVKRYITKESISKEEFDLICQIIKIRIDSNISQRELAKLTGISQPNIARFEKSLHSTKLSTVLKILNSLGYTLKIEKK